MTLYRIGGVTVTVNHAERRIVHAWPDGLTLEVNPTLDADDRALARRLGYLEPWAMHVDHELVHHWLAVHWEGWDWSPTLHKVAMWGQPPPSAWGEVGPEERAVLAYQLALPKPGPRPWE